MEVVFLGTGTSQGVPIIGCHCEVCESKDPRDKRTRSSVWINTGSHKILIDAGPDLRSQLLREKIEDVDLILLTHEHKDHSGGLDDIRPIYFRKAKPMPLYALGRTIESIKKEYSYIFDKDPYPGAPQLQLHEINSKAFMIDELEIIPILSIHYGSEILGFRIGDFAYITDAKTIPEEEIAKLQGLDTLVINALRRKPHYSHLNLEEALDYIKLINPNKAYLTHCSHYMGLFTEFSDELPENVYAAYDGLRLY